MFSHYFRMKTNTLILEKDTQCGLGELARGNTSTVTAFVLAHSLNFLNKNITGKIGANIEL